MLSEDCWTQYNSESVCSSHSTEPRYKTRRSFFKDGICSRLSDHIEISPRENSEFFEDDLIICSKLLALDKLKLISGGGDCSGGGDGDRDKDEDGCTPWPSCQENTTLSLVHVALQLRSEWLIMPKNEKVKLTDDNCINCVPESLYYVFDSHA